MNLRYIIIIGFALFFTSKEVKSQTVFQPKPVDINMKGVLYDFERVFEMRIHPQGFAIGYKKGRLRSYYRTSYQNFEFGYVKDPREKRTNREVSIPGFRVSSPYIYGKQNEFYTLRYSYGEKRYLSEKTRRKGLAVGIIYEGGLTMGLLKPYSLRFLRSDVDNPSDQFLELVEYSDEFRDDFLDERIIYGGAGFFKGWGSLSPIIGLHGKIGMHWGIGAFESKAKAIETGIMFDIFPGKVPILIEQDDISNSFYFFKLYLSFQFGNRKRIGEE